MNAPNSHPRLSERGNALWFILIAVALLAAITVMLTRSGSSVDQSGDQEQLGLKASQIMRFGKSVEASIQQLMMNGCSENEISFENDTLPGAYENTGSPADNSCHVFKVQGTGLNWQSFSDLELANYSQDVVLTTDIMLMGVGDDADPAGKDLLMFVAVSPDLCTQFNSMLSTPNGIEVKINDFSVEFTGSFTATSRSLGDTAPQGPEFNGKSAGCFMDADGNPTYYQVLLAR